MCMSFIRLPVRWGKPLLLVFSLGRHPESALNCVLGFDGRHSSAGFAATAAAGLQAQGIYVHRLGLVPSPVTYLYFIWRHLSVNDNRQP